MKILALEIEIPHVSPEQFQPLLQSEARRVWDLVQQGVIREAYFQATQHLAVLVLECDDLNAARATIQSLPLVQAGLIDFNLLPLVPYDGFARLFSAEQAAGAEPGDQA